MSNDQPIPGLPAIAAVVLAAGHSRRMGSPKMVLPWGDTTVIGQVISVLSRTKIREIVVVTGGAQTEVECALQGLPVRLVYNPQHAKGEMLSSFQVGLAALSDAPAAILLVLGDQPQIQEGVINELIQVYADTGALLVLPSYRMRRGHPWLMDSTLIASVLALQEPATLRDFLNEWSSTIRYIMVETPTVLQDLDTPGDYHTYRSSTSVSPQVKQEPDLEN